MIENDPKLRTVLQERAKKLVDLVEEGVPAKDAEVTAGITLNRLRQPGILKRVGSDLLKRIKDAGLDTPEAQRAIGKARLIEQALQTEDERLAQRAAKELAKDDNPLVAIQQNFGTQDPEILAMLQSLGLNVPEKEEEE